ncbi:uncharacterized protein LOC134347359 [Mobula hypostoma]|uniref:uncharacterized protein LOC134347359 n=1 Tax=Mobula hypostoma TaxID=723540 RepID=UPI002FC2ECBB
MRKDPYRHIVTFMRYEHGSWAAENGVTRYELVRDSERGNASIRIKQLSVEDSHSYLCLAEFRKMNHDYSSYGDHVKPPFIHVFQSEIQLQVRPAPGESVSVMTGTEGASATLPCEFTRSPQSLTAHTVTWMRKDPYRHIVTFRRYENGSWAAENGVTRYELVRDPERGNAFIRIKQLSMNDSHSYLCLAAFRKKSHNYSSYRDHVKPPFIHVFQSEIQLQVRPANSNSHIYVLLVLVPLFLVCVLAASWKKKVHLWLMGRIRGTKRNVPRLTQSEQEQKPPESVHDSSPLYDNIIPSSNNKVQDSSPVYDNIVPSSNKKEQPDSCTYASILFGGEKASKPQAKDQGGQKQEAGPAEVIYAAVVKKHSWRLARLLILARLSSLAMENDALITLSSESSNASIFLITAVGISTSSFVFVSDIGSTHHDTYLPASLKDILDKSLIRDFQRTQLATLPWNPVHRGCARPHPKDTRLPGHPGDIKNGQSASSGSGNPLL